MESEVTARLREKPFCDRLIPSPPFQYSKRFPRDDYTRVRETLLLHLYPLDKLGLVLRVPRYEKTQPEREISSLNHERTNKDGVYTEGFTCKGLLGAVSGFKGDLLQGLDSSGDCLEDRSGFFQRSTLYPSVLYAEMEIACYENCSSCKLHTTPHYDPFASLYKAVSIVIIIFL